MSQFTKVPGRVIEEFKLRVVYVAANPPSPVPEEEEEEENDLSPRPEVTAYEVKIPAVFDAVTVSTHTDTSGAKIPSAEGAFVESTLVAERECAVDENQKLQRKMELLSATRSSQQGFSLMFVMLVFMSSVYIGHLMKHIKV
ncbi:hypothetical protein ABZP36_007972 [Zizania latifolia]